MAKKASHKQKVGKKKASRKAHKSSVRLEPTLKHMGKHGGHKKSRRKRA